MEARAEQRDVAVADDRPAQPCERRDGVVSGVDDRRRERDHAVGHLAQDVAAQPPVCVPREHLVGAEADRVAARVDEEELLLDAEADGRALAEAMREQRVVWKSKSHRGLPGIGVGMRARTTARHVRPGGRPGLRPRRRPRRCSPQGLLETARSSLPAVARQAPSLRPCVD